MKKIRTSKRLTWTFGADFGADSGADFCTNDDPLHDTSSPGGQDDC
jgi:hypothetical protein